MSIIANHFTVLDKEYAVIILSDKLLLPNSISIKLSSYLPVTTFATVYCYYSLFLINSFF